MKAGMTKLLAGGIVLFGVVFCGPADVNAENEGQRSTIDILGKGLMGAEVYVAGEKAGVISEQVGDMAHFSSAVRPGRSLVEIKKDGKTVWQKEIQAEEGGDYSLGVSLAGEARSTGACTKSCAIDGAGCDAPDSASDSSGIAWTNDLAEGFRTAARQRKPLMVGFYAPWCRWCRKLDKEVYADPAVIKAAAGFVAVKLDIDQHKKEAQRYGIRVIPTVVFFNSDGSEKTRISKCPPPAKFCEVMSRAARE